MKNTVIIIISLLCMNCSFNNNKINVSAGENGNIQFEIPETISELSEGAIIKKSPNKARRPSKMFVKENDDTYEFNLNYKIDKGNSTLEELSKTYSELYASRGVKIITSEIKEINNKEVLYMNLKVPPQSVNTSKVEEISHFFVTFSDQKTVIGSIRYPSSKSELYDAESLDILNSFTVK